MTAIAPRSPRLHLQRYLIAGLLTLLPLWLTWLVFSFVFGLLSGASAPWIGVLFEQLARSFPRAMGWLAQPWSQSVLAVIATIALIYLTGLLATRVLGQRLLAAIEAVIARIPLAQTIYSGTKQLLEALKTKPGGGQRVVLIDFPQPGMKAVGVVTRTIRDAASGREYAAVYVPTTPNPTSGYLELVPLEDVTPTDWSMDQAMAFIISGGAVAPQSIAIGNIAPARPGSGPG
jgi:uncharacterized membrane protein